MTKTIEIYWYDLTEKKQKEILEETGDNHNWDVFPLATMEYEVEPVSVVPATGDIIREEK